MRRKRLSKFIGFFLRVIWSIRSIVCILLGGPHFLECHRQSCECEEKNGDAWTVILVSRCTPVVDGSWMHPLSHFFSPFHHHLRHYYFLFGENMSNYDYFKVFASNLMSISHIMNFFYEFNWNCKKILHYQLIIDVGYYKKFDFYFKNL